MAIKSCSEGLWNSALKPRGQRGKAGAWQCSIQPGASFTQCHVLLKSPEWKKGLQEGSWELRIRRLLLKNGLIWEVTYQGCLRGLLFSDSIREIDLLPVEKVHKIWLTFSFARTFSYPSPVLEVWVSGRKDHGDGYSSFSHSTRTPIPGKSCSQRLDMVTKASQCPRPHITVQDITEEFYVTRHGSVLL